MLFAYIAGLSFVLQDLYGLSVPAFSGVYALNGFGILLAASLSGKLAEKCSAWQISETVYGVLYGWWVALDCVTLFAKINLVNHFGFLLDCGTCRRNLTV